MSKINMSFDIDVAKIVGTDCAIILSNIEFWQSKNKANKHNFHDGKYWTYNSISAWTELFSYLTPSKIRTCLKRLEHFDYVVTGNYNKSNYDRTKWYSSIRQLDLSRNANGVVKVNEPIPVINPIINPDIKQTKKNNVSPEFEEVFDPNQISLIDEIKEKEKSCEKKGEGKLTKILIVDNKGNYHNLPISDVNFIKEKEKSSAKKETFNFRKEMIDLGFSEDLVLDWLAVRKKLKATNTKTALNGFLREVEKTGEDKNKILELCAERGWKGFRLSYWTDLKKREQSGNGNSAVDNLIKAMKVNQ